MFDSFDRVPRVNNFGNWYKSSFFLFDSHTGSLEMKHSNSWTCHRIVNKKERKNCDSNVTRSLSFSFSVTRYCSFSLCESGILVELLPLFAHPSIPLFCSVRSRNEVNNFTLTSVFFFFSFSPHPPLQEKSVLQSFPSLLLPHPSSSSSGFRNYSFLSPFSWLFSCFRKGKEGNFSFFPHMFLVNITLSIPHFDIPTCASSLPWFLNRFTQRQELFHWTSNSYICFGSCLFSSFLLRCNQRLKK